MLKEKARAVDAAVRVLDVALVVAAFPIAHAIRGALEPALPPLFPVRHHLTWVVAGVGLWLASAAWAGVYGQYRTRSLFDELGRILRACVGFAIGLGAATFAVREMELSRGLVGVWSATAFGLLVTTRVALRAAARAARRRGYNTRSFAIVGAGPLARAMRENLLDHPAWGFRFAGVILDDAAGPRPAELRPVLGTLAELPEILERRVIDLVVFAVGRERLHHLEDALATCAELGIAAKVALDVFPERPSRVVLEELDGVPVLSVEGAPHRYVELVAKRTIDVVVSALVLVVVSPVLALAALAIRLESPGPVLFRQRRVGQNGRAFTLLKFRSMRVGAEAELPALRAHNEMDGPVFKMRSDPRVTRVGRVLRKTSVDELPQLWNVLRGEMSIVGPRPPLPSEVRRYERWQRRRLSVKPGITCTWQVSGRNEVGFDRWMELDLEYIDQWSLWGDVRILLRTIPAILLGRGAR